VKIQGTNEKNLKKFLTAAAIKGKDGFPLSRE
jgi:hypothetical protein